MKYLILIADYTGSCIQDEYNHNRISLNDLDIPEDLRKNLKSWHAEYRKIIPLPDEERSQIMDKIESLDAQGIKLAKKISELIPGGAKVKYYSEGKYKYLQV